MKLDKRLQIYYSGSVQGVGFRFAAERIAVSLGLTGWVKNLEDGRVEIVCEGSESKLNQLLEKIEYLFKGYLVGSKIKWDEATGEFSGFDIRH